MAFIFKLLNCMILVSPISPHKPKVFTSLYKNKYIDRYMN